MLKRLNKLGGLNRYSGKSRRADFLPSTLRDKFLFLWTGKYDGDNLLLDLGSEVITVRGKDWTTSYVPSETLATFEVPDDSVFSNADGLDDFWFDSLGVIQQKTLDDLISSTALRTFIKYADFEPFNVYAIGILKDGEIITGEEKVILNRYFKLWAEYWGVLMDSGYMKDNRVGGE